MQSESRVNLQYTTTLMIGHCGPSTRRIGGVRRLLAPLPADGRCSTLGCVGCGLHNPQEPTVLMDHWLQYGTYTLIASFRLLSSSDGRLHPGIPTVKNSTGFMGEEGE